MKINALEKTLSHAKTVYDDFAATWRDIERKAQGNIAIAGIFLAGSSLIFRTVENPSCSLAVVFFISVALLAISAIVSVFVLLVSEMEGIEDIEVFRKIAENSVEADDSENAKESYIDFLLKQIQSWEKTCVGLYNENSIKAKRLKAAQIILIIGVFGVVSVIFWALFLT